MKIELGAHVAVVPAYPVWHLPGDRDGFTACGLTGAVTLVYGPLVRQRLRPCAVCREGWPALLEAPASDRRLRRKVRRAARPAVP